jgi:hypothetical protein
MSNCLALDLHIHLKMYMYIFNLLHIHVPVIYMTIVINKLQTQATPFKNALKDRSVSKIYYAKLITN